MDVAGQARHLHELPLAAAPRAACAPGIIGLAALGLAFGAAQRLDALGCEDSLELVGVEPDSETSIALVDDDFFDLDPPELPFAFDAVHGFGESRLSRPKAAMS